MKVLVATEKPFAAAAVEGIRKEIEAAGNELVLPTIKGSPASGVVVRVAGITGRVRGMKFKRADGRSVRPSLVIVDDPQTTESAGSVEQTRKRVRVLAGDILGLAGPGQKMSGIMPCTVIRPGDMAEQLLDRKEHPEWNGERTRLVYEFPRNTALWDEYAEIRADALREDGNIARATEFYREHREAMDAGAVVAWPERYNHDELSAVQYAMDLKLTDEAAFQSEYQNDPLPEDYGGDVRTLLAAGEFLPATFYLQAMRLRQCIIEEFRAKFREVDAFLFPTIPCTALKLSELYSASKSIRDMDAFFTCIASLTGLPALNIPCGLDHEGLPIGMQLLGRPFDEATLYRIGAAFETAFNLYEQLPAFH